MNFLYLLYLLYLFTNKKIEGDQILKKSQAVALVRTLTDLKCISPGEYVPFTNFRKIGIFGR